MKVTLESTSQIVQISKAHYAGGCVEARVWVGRTESGVEVQCLIARIAADKTSDLSQFEAELTEQHAPTPEVLLFPLRMLI